MRNLFTLLFVFCSLAAANAAGKYDNPDTIVVARDGTGEFRTVGEAIEVCRAFMDYHKVIFIKKGIYKEKLIIPSWLQNIELCGEDRDKTVITYDDHANIKSFLPAPSQPGGEMQPMGTFRTYTLKIEGNDITLTNLTIENNSARLGQAVALHTEGDRLVFRNCRFIGHQDTVYTGVADTRLFFYQCYICGTTDFIFGPSTAWFEECTIESLINSYVTAASTPQNQPYGYIFSHCRLIAAPGVDKVYLGRPWRDYGYTLFMNCELGSHIRPEGWHHWEKQREQTARYYEYNNSGEGARPDARVAWSRQLTRKEAQQVTLEHVFHRSDNWTPTWP
jgi:pectinesterase